MKLNRKGFSLIEVLIVIAILALIASLVVPMVQRNRDEAAYEVSVMNLIQVGKAMEKHYLETGSYPVFASWNEVAAEDSPLREYINEIPTDGKGRPYRVVESTENDYVFEGLGIGYNKNDQSDFTVSAGVKLKKKKGGDN